MTSSLFGAIDVGSNAVRLLIASIEDDMAEIKPKKTIFLRLPLRLGEDVFSTGRISAERIERLIYAMKAFKNLLLTCDVVGFRVCATAAMREAKNRCEIVSRIKKETGLLMEIIDGKEEARIIYESHIADQLATDRRYIYVDVGGGSTEITLIEDQKMCESFSFNIGTLRILAGTVEGEEWEKLDSFLRKIKRGRSPLEIIASGGNINKIYRMINPDSEKKMSVEKLKKNYTRLKKTSLEERINNLGMRPDRADVIIPAAELFLHIAEVAQVTLFNVPTIGLADGILHKLCQEYRTRQSKH